MSDQCHVHQILHIKAHCEYIITKFISSFSCNVDCNQGNHDKLNGIWNIKLDIRV